MVESSEITQRTFSDYKTTCKLVLEILGKTKIVETLHPVDFTRLREKLSKGRGLVALGNQIRQNLSYS